MNSTIEIPTIADTCMLAILSRKRLATTRRVDDNTRDHIRTQLGDESLTLSKHLFKEGEVRDLLRLLDRAYDDHKLMTVPYVDRGPRLLPAVKFEEYAERMEGHKLKIEAGLEIVVDQWSHLVREDMRRRASKCTTVAQQTLIDVAEYPNADDAAHMFSMTWRVRPVSKGEDFRTEVPQWMKDRLQEELESAGDIIRRDLLKCMLKPCQDAVERLKIPIGEKGAVFRDSLVQNLHESLKRAKELNVTNDPDLDVAIAEMNLVVNGHLGSAESLRTMEGKRVDAVKRLNSLVDTLGGML